MKKLILFAICIMIFCCDFAQADTPDIKIINTADLAEHDLTSRKGTLLIEVDYGTVLNRKGDGVDDSGNYICYKRLGRLRKGTRIKSYFLYNPDTNYVDDVVYRYDVILRR